MEKNNTTTDNFLLRYWWIWPLTFLLMATVLVLDALTGPFFTDSLFSNICFIALLTIAFIAGVMQIVTLIFSISRKKWKKFGGILTGIILCAIGTAAVIFLWVLAFFGAPLKGFEDHFGLEHPIPDTIRCEVPLVETDYWSYNENDTVSVNKKDVVPVIDSTDTNSFLQIHEGFQPGIYEYDFYYHALPDGPVYIKCYEATENIPLSEEYILERSRHEVHDHNSFRKIVNRQEFKIYEGSWGEPYAVRVEVWHHNDDTKHDNLLVSKIYKMEGWMR